IGTHDAATEAFVPRQSTGPRHAAPDDDDDVGPFGAAPGADLTGGADHADPLAPDGPDGGESAEPEVPAGHSAHGQGDEDTMFGHPTSSLRSSPLQVTRAGVLPATVPAPRSDDEPYDHTYDEAAVAAGYRDALPPPGVRAPHRADVTVQLFV